MATFPFTVEPGPLLAVRAFSRPELKEEDLTVARYRRKHCAFPRSDLNSSCNKQARGRGGDLVLELMKVVGHSHKAGSWARGGSVSLADCEKTQQREVMGTQRADVKIGLSILFSRVATSGEERQQGESFLVCNSVVLTGFPCQDCGLWTLLGHG